MNRKTRIFLCLCFTLFFGDLDAQGIDKKISSNYLEWSEGSVTSLDGKNLQGLLKYNSMTGLLSFESGEVSKSFTARTVAAFDFFDALQEKKRVFITVEYDEVNSDQKTPFETKSGSRKTKYENPQKIPQFFEVLMEFPEFALLSKIGRLNVKDEINRSPGLFDNNTQTWDQTTSTTISYSQIETLYIFDRDGNINPFLEVTDKVTDRLIFDSSSLKAKTIDGSVLQKYTSPHYSKLVDFAKENNLSFKVKEDIIKILEFYKSLISN